MWKSPHVQQSGLHHLFHPTIRDGSTWSKFGARGEHGDVFPVLQLRCALILRKLNQIFIACLFKGSQEQSFFLQTLLFTAFVVMVLKISTYTLVSTWSSVSSGYEHVKQLMQPWLPQPSLLWTDFCWTLGRGENEKVFLGHLLILWHCLQGGWGCKGWPGWFGAIFPHSCLGV